MERDVMRMITKNALAHHTRAYYSGTDKVIIFCGAACVLPELSVEGSSGGVGDEVTDSTDPHYGSFAVPVNVNGTVCTAYINAPLYRSGNTADVLDWTAGKVIRKISGGSVLPTPSEENVICPVIEQSEGITVLDVLTSVTPSALKVSALVYTYASPSEYADIAGLEADFEHNTFTRLAGAAGRSPGTDFSVFAPYGDRTRCNVADDGRITARFGDAAYRDDGSNGQVMVYQPKFYYCVIPMKTEVNPAGGFHIRKAHYYISAVPRPGFKLHPAFYGEHGKPVDYIMYSAYEGVLYDTSAERYVNDGTDTGTAFDADADLICSVASQKPISGRYKSLTRMNFEKLASNRGAGWHGDMFKAESANQMLFAVEYASFNSQNVLGPGVVDLPSLSGNNAVLTGSTASLGNGSGSAPSSVAELNGTQTIGTAPEKVAVSYRGMENPWGNVWKHLSGINVYGSGEASGGRAYIADDYSFSDSKYTENYKSVGFALPQSSSTGYISAFGFASEAYDWAFIPSELGGSANGPVGDMCLTKSDLSGGRTAAYGGYWGRGENCGAFLLLMSSAVAYKSFSIGGRLVYVPSDN